MEMVKPTKECKLSDEYTLLIAQNYFNALRRMDFKRLIRSLKKKEVEEFQRTHIIAATREVRPDIVRYNNETYFPASSNTFICRSLFQYTMKGRDTSYLHRVLLWSDKQSDDETFRKTALEWAVENNDRLCTTEILHQGRRL